jgi:glycosyltransferase involved in cell wall biosynthesis
MNGSLIIVIPCYNEFDRLQQDLFESFLKQDNDTRIVFSNDGSTDKTIEKLNAIRSMAPDRVFIRSLEKNKGKAEAIREGVLYCFAGNLQSDRIAYLDADGSTSLSECHSISRNINGDVIFAFGSRILKIDNNIIRKPYRHLIGRILATVISSQLKIHVYDTQCGCKVFRSDLAKEVFRDGFISKWLFDVEIFHRIIRLYGKDRMRQICAEIPLQDWIDTADSKVRFTYSFRIWYDILRIKRKYR